ncbi:hypothetical protein GLOIN_2v1546150 [Rhizophagus irregularis DAOM 181602=DAOM 197198]|nr:hypothetical protein GLOIN_2v1546150 [Rhizophagus irregularis DAOM 181602=DAOM 197198]
MIVQTYATLTSPDQKLITKICTPLKLHPTLSKEKIYKPPDVDQFWDTPEKLQKAEGKKERREKFTKKIRKIHNPRKTNPKE